MSTKKNSTYRLTAEDLPYAVGYLINACKNAQKKDVEYLEISAVTNQAWIKFLESYLESNDPEYDAQSLHSQCKKALTPKQWNAMRVSIRQRKHKSKNTNNHKHTGTKHVDISLAAYSVLKELVDTKQARNLSEAIILLSAGRIGPEKMAGV